jgi:cell division GTPase FtsZ
MIIKTESMNMKQPEIMKELSTEPQYSINMPDFLARMSVRNHPVMPLPVSTKYPPFFDGFDSFDGFDEAARIMAVGVGPLGAQMAHLLSRNLPGITCHEVIFDPKGESSEQMAALLSSVRKSDLLFVLTGFDDEYSGVVAKAVGHSAHEAGILSLAIIPHQCGMSPNNIAELAEVVDTVFAVSDSSLTDKQDPLLVRKDALAGYSIRHIVTTISCLINQRSFTCVDFADIVTIMQSGSTGRLGIGVASGPARGGNAAKRALERLAAQGISTFDATGVLSIVQGSSLFTMDDFSDVNRVMHDHVAEDAKIIVGFITDDQLGDNVRVSVMPVW